MQKWWKEQEANAVAKSLSSLTKGEAVHEAFNASMGMIALLREKNPVLLVPHDLGLFSPPAYHKSPLIPVIAVMDEGSAPYPGQLCAALIPGISEIKIYEETKIIYHGLSQPLVNLTVDGKKADKMSWVLAHSNFAPQCAIPGTKIHSPLSNYWEKTISAGRQCYIYECVLSKSS